MNLKLEAIVIPVSDIDHAKKFYQEKLGFRLDVDPADEQNMVFSVQQPTSPNVFKGVITHVAWKQKPS